VRGGPGVASEPPRALLVLCSLSLSSNSLSDPSCSEILTRSDPPTMPTLTYCVRWEGEEPMAVNREKESESRRLGAPIANPSLASTLFGRQSGARPAAVYPCFPSPPTPAIRHPHTLRRSCRNSRVFLEASCDFVGERERRKKTG